MNVDDIEIHPYRMADLYNAIEDKVARFNRENPAVDLVKLANVVADRLTPSEARFMIVNAVYDALESEREEGADN